MKKIWISILCAVVLFVSVTPTSWAYRIRVTNGLNAEDAEFTYGEPSSFMVFYGFATTFDGSLNRGHYSEFSTTDWKTAGVCWDKIMVRMPRWPGCPGDNRYIEKALAKCRDIMITYKSNRSQCSIDFEVLDQ